MRLETIYLILRIIGTFLATGHFLGFLMYWSTSQPVAAGIPIALLLLSLTPVAKIKSHPWLLIVVVILVTVSYIVAGIQFLNTQEDIVARLLHFIELLLICIFVLYALIKMQGAKPRQD